MVGNRAFQKPTQLVKSNSLSSVMGENSLVPTSDEEC